MISTSKISYHTNRSASTGTTIRVKIMLIYVDNLRVFRFVPERDSVWRKNILETDDLVTQWRQVMASLKVDVSYALSPQAKGKVERPYRWLQDRIVRTCALEKLTHLEEVRPILKAEVERYNNYQVYSTTGEIPRVRFEKARQTGNSLFRPLTMPQPYTSLKDIFCLHSTRRVSGCGFVHYPRPGAPSFGSVHLVAEANGARLAPAHSEQTSSLLNFIPAPAL